MKQMLNTLINIFDLSVNVQITYIMHIFITELSVVSL